MIRVAEKMRMMEAEKYMSRKQLIILDLKNKLRFCMSLSDRIMNTSNIQLTMNPVSTSRASS